MSSSGQNAAILGGRGPPTSGKGKTPPSPITSLGLSGAAGMIGWMPVHPLDVLKVRMQLNAEGGKARLYKNSGDAFLKVLRNEGVRGLYGGLSAGLTRQATYTTLRGGIYNILRDLSTVDGQPPRLIAKLGCGLVAGGTASFICCPVEVALVRMQADGRLPLSERRNYANVIDAVGRIIREEGLRSCWRGSMPTVARAMVANMVQFASYDQAKEFYASQTPLKEGVPLHLAASITSGFLYSAASLPLDIAKTRVQNSTSSLPPSISSVLLQIAKKEGVLSLWKGFLPYFGRGGGHSIFMFMALEQLRSAARSAGSPYLSLQYTPHHQLPFSGVTA